jgi:hypothetical protein
MLVNTFGDGLRDKLGNQKGNSWGITGIQCLGKYNSNCWAGIRQGLWYSRLGGLACQGSGGGEAPFVCLECLRMRHVKSGIKFL